MHNYNFDGAGYVHCKYVEVDRNKMIKDINLIYAKMKYARTLLIIVFASVVQLFYGQERYTISGEFPDRSLMVSMCFYMNIQLLLKNLNV